MRTRVFLSPSNNVLVGSYPQDAEHIHAVCDSANAAFTVQLPDVNMPEHKEFVFYNYPSSGAGNNVTVVPVTGQLLINSDTSHVLKPNDTVTFVADLKKRWLLSDVNTHDRLHALDSTSDHSSTITIDYLMKADASGLPSQATNTDTQVSNAVTKAHDRSHAIDGTSDHTGISGTESNFMALNASGLPKDSGSKAADFATAAHTHTPLSYWLEPAINFYSPVAATPVSPGTGDRYISNGTGNGWTTAYIYEYNGATWDETIPVLGSSIYVKNIDKYFYFSWAGEWWIIKYHYQLPVVSIYDNTIAIPVAPVDGNRYIAKVSANTWTINNIYEYSGNTWKETAAAEGMTLYNLATNTMLIFDASNWIVGTHDAVTVADTTAINMSLSGQQVSADFGANASTVLPLEWSGTPTYKYLSDYMNMTRSAGRLTGGVVTATAPADGTVYVTAMKAAVIVNTTLGSAWKFIDIAQSSAITPTDGVASYIYYDAVAAAYSHTTDHTAINNYSQFVVGRVFRIGTDVEIHNAGMNIFNKDRRMHNRLIDKYGAMDRVSGAIISEVSALKLKITGGSWYTSDTAYTTAEVDTSGAGVFYLYYRSGASTWTKSAGTQTVPVLQYNRLSDNTLQAISASQYGVYWVYLDPEGDVYLVYGQANYTNVASAQAATIPSSLPPECTNWSIFIGKIIFQKSAASLYSVESAFSSPFALSSAVNHNDLAGLQGGTAGEYYHTTSAQNSALHAASGQFNQATSGEIAGLTLKSVPTTSDIILIEDAAASNAKKYTTLAGTAAMTQTLTATRLQPRVTQINSSATPTFNTDNCELLDITALSANITSMTTSCTGTPTNGQPLLIRIKDNGTARTIAWGTLYEAVGVALPTTTVISKRLLIGLIYDTTTSKWGCVAVNNEA